MAETGPTKVREAVGIFDTADQLLAAAEDLREAGFDHADLSLMASDKAIEEKLGERYRRAEDLADDPRTPRVAYVGREETGTGAGFLAGGLGYVGAAVATGAVVASGGALAPAIAAAVAGGAGGGALGAVLGKVLDTRYHEGLEHQIDRGGLLLWVNVRRPENEEKAMELLRRHGGRNVEVHDIPALGSTVA
ncbi:MAG TPA: hypothetical protein VFO41_10530 [Alphaproteobacteria bacterium]|nr:hypothetical protein [Alphaproteobacteria bacterium]